MSVSDFTFHPLLSSVKLFRLFRIELELKFASPGSLRAWLDNLKRVRAGSRKLLAQYLTKGNSIIGVKIDFYIFCHLSSRHQIQEKSQNIFILVKSYFEIPFDLLSQHIKMSQKYVKIVISRLVLFSKV